jgi:hypothetical protein
MIAIRSLIISKLKKENAKKNDKKSTRDYIHELEFDASIFLLLTITRYTILNRVHLLGSSINHRYETSYFKKRMRN